LRYVFIDGYKRMAALRQLGKDTVVAEGWPMGEAEAFGQNQQRQTQHKSLPGIGHDNRSIVTRPQRFCLRKESSSGSPSPLACFFRALSRSLGY
jgi:hypothetical protein